MFYVSLTLKNVFETKSSMEQEAVSVPHLAHLRSSYPLKMVISRWQDPSIHLPGGKLSFLSALSTQS